MIHRYFRKTIKLDLNINKKESQQWVQDKHLTSHFTAYVCAVEEQAIATKYLINKRQLDEGKPPTISNKYRLCKTNIKDITYIFILYYVKFILPTDVTWSSSKSNLRTQRKMRILRYYSQMKKNSLKNRR